MTKPDIDTIRWAQDASAVKSPTTSTEWEFGWEAPGGVEELPILNYQNYWQNAVQNWIQFFDGAIPDLSDAAVDTFDLFEWTTGHLDFGRLPVAASVSSTSMAVLGNNLAWLMIPSGAVAGDWGSQILDTISGAMTVEIKDILNRGLGVQVNDLNSDTWTIYLAGNTLGGVFPATNENSVSVVTGIGVGIDGTVSDIVVLKNGVIQGSPRFATFAGFADPADGANIFSTLNPNGVRVVAVGVQALSLRLLNQVRGLRRGYVPLRRWYRPFDVGYSTAESALGDMRWPIQTAIAEGNSLRVTYSLDTFYTTPAPSTKLDFYLKEDASGSLVLRREANNTNEGGTMRGVVPSAMVPAGGFTGLQVRTTAPVTSVGFRRTLASPAGMQTLFASHLTNYVLIEEIH